ncbi:MAG: AMP-binding protein [Litoreibacter sp.]
MGWLENETGLDKTKANHVPLTPLSHLARAATVFPDKEALVYHSFRLTYREYRARISQLASALHQRGIAPGDVVATLLPNIPAQAEAHFGVPACGAVLNTINTRLDSGTVAYIFEHGGAKIVLVDTQFLPLAEAAKDAMDREGPEIIEVPDIVADYPATGRFPDYDAFLQGGDPNFPWIMPDDEWESLALNYTSGTTGRPKGVVYHHRGAYLMTMGTVISWRMVLYPRFLAIVPLFHCNGWNHTWMMPLLGGTVICCRDVSAQTIYDAISQHHVTHFGGPPIVLNLLVNSPQERRKPFSHRIEVFTAGAPPAPATLAAVTKLGFNITQVYGLTETYGHVTECLWDDAWDDQPQDVQSSIKARQGVAMPMMEYVTVVDNENRPTPHDGKTHGEIVMQGNAVMKGYYKDKDATTAAFTGQHFHSGDIAVQHPDGHIQIVDRAKDIIISGGENVSSVEVEGVLMGHPAVSLCAVVAKPDDKWGEVPCAFVELKEGQIADPKTLIDFAQSQLAGFKTPKKIIFMELPKTSTGKIQKYALRETAKTL